ncbi:MAG: hypothetical protein AAB527_02155, partial [Patescibacteria group bacterium]
MTTINYDQIQKVADFIRKMPASKHGMNFYSFKNKNGVDVPALDMHPPLNHPQTINFFFFVCMHMYGFWYGDHIGYVSPMYGTVNGKECKGADLIMKCATKFLNAGGDFSPEYFARITPKEFAEIFSDDNGPIVFPDFEMRYKLTRAYGEFLCRTGISPLDGIENVNKYERPLEMFLEGTGIFPGAPGYIGDPLLKKNTLLAMALANRPEHFLKVGPDEEWPPIVDYHLMRLALRLGLIELDPLVAKVIIERVWVNEETENEIRNAVFFAVGAVIAESGKT